MTLQTIGFFYGETSNIMFMAILCGLFVGFFLFTIPRQDMK